MQHTFPGSDRGADNCPVLADQRTADRAAGYTCFFAHANAAAGGCNHHV